MQQLAGIVPPKLSVTRAETKQQGWGDGEKDAAAGWDGVAAEVFSQAGCLQGLSLGLHGSLKLLYFGLSA